jgi:hypothetical protein
MRIRDDFIPSGNAQKETTNPDRLQGPHSEAEELGGGRRIRELLAVIEQISWRTYLKEKSRHSR